ncbi:AraC family transcriptional regulator [Marinobacterium jannaschii]|uniref:AraC family transcriptional regulator n=1 Tax=Marinobacterium jannaschii TaxID=64970 RepID=UPI000685F8EE|nr:AraC family transcriptional regulator [Marinobacterium jannaschii]
MKQTVQGEMPAPIQRVIDYIDHHLDEELSLDRLSQVAHISRFHFHRQFSAWTGMTLARVIQLQRLKRASWQLVFDPQLRIIDIALEAGFDSPEAFARAFRKAFSQTPSDFRQNPQWQPWVEKYKALPFRGKRDQQVQIVDYPETRLAVYRHHGDPALIYQSVQHFIAYRRSVGLAPDKTRTFNLIYMDPEQVEPEAFYIDLACSLTANRIPAGEGIVEGLIPGGRCALLRHHGTLENIGDSVRYLYCDWLPQSGEQLRDDPCFFHHLTLIPQVHEHKNITDIYLPLC